MKLWNVRRVHHYTDRDEKELGELLKDGWEPFAAQQSERLHHPTESWIWLRKEEEKT